jgi:eukaryotic-like serine/threonine-protein kinase
MGTVTYMSPEQVRGDPPDYRSDIFSFGLILYELLTGERAFQGETAVDTMRAILRQDAPELPEAVPAPVRQIVTRCLEKDPRNRFQSTKDLAFALTQTGGQSGSQSAKTAALPVRSKRSRLAAVALAGVALLVLGIVAGRLMSRAPAATQWSAVRLVGPEIAMDPHLSPDGHLLAFEAMVDGLSQVAVMKPESGNWSVLTHRRDYG